MTYQQLTAKTMPPEKRAKASRCVVGHYLVRPISNIISMPLIEKKINPTSVTILSGVFPILSFLSFLFLKGALGFWIGWLCIFVWNVLDGVDGNIARYNEVCSKHGELWDATVGWIAMIAFYMGMGFEAYFEPGNTLLIGFIPNYIYIVLGSIAAICWIFPRLVMQKKNVLMGGESVSAVKGRENYGFLKLAFFNLTSINGLAAVLFALGYCLHLNAWCMICYFIISMMTAVGSLYTLLK